MTNSKKTATRNQILMATFECLAEKGTTAITLRDIATKADITLSLIHYYFPTKEGLLVDATSYVMQKQIKDIQKELSNIQDFSEQLKKLIFVVHHQFKSAEWRKVYFSLLAAAAWSPKIMEEIRLLQNQLIDLIQENAQNSNVKITNLEAFSRVLLASLNGLALQVMHGASEEQIAPAYAITEKVLLSLISN
ncbi:MULTISPECIES: TetR/AcrR family transcriptional regulator [Bacillus cereus group]|uniref:TetR family transcriptional regulator n=3 Tax=Bacillus thuringiensis TaxID=1428 RepID=A0A1W6WY05_BACTU|nr:MULTISPECIES: TetR/AcrR family transcriptional regulator [Bacillus cereus group]MEC2878702.1 TetR/AcrR family transcriptional regulator [Bacillus cereus]AGG05620.1 Transcriptional regulator, TetR family [Bacillus thuringiensis serovar thuringiensis str. IS5056]ARP61189.1 TetR family transcriptional regulator [Bacillus thuringiensis]AST05179.1 TetR family transcriptional regulator [Bacillus thuringiensis]MBG9620797.1 transcriptional regulator [Bacillus thuringiensis]